MRNRPQAKTSWGEYILEARKIIGMSQKALAAAVGVDRTTVWRWENEDRRPESLDLVIKVAYALGLAEGDALAAAGFAPPVRMTESYDSRLEGLDPNDPVVRHILSLDIDEETRAWMLNRRREILALRREQDLRELDIIIRRERGAA